MLEADGAPYRLFFYTSPYKRSHQTYEAVASCFQVPCLWTLISVCKLQLSQRGSPQLIMSASLTPKLCAPGSLLTSYHLAMQHPGAYMKLFNLPDAGHLMGTQQQPGAAGGEGLPGCWTSAVHAPWHPHLRKMHWSCASKCRPTNFPGHELPAQARQVAGQQEEVQLREQDFGNFQVGTVVLSYK